MNNQALLSEIELLLRKGISDIDKIELKDVTEKHRKHRGFTEGRYHIKLKIVSNSLSSKNRLSAHKQIYHLLDSLMQETIHSLVIQIESL